MENTSATIFSRRYVVDSIGFQDRAYTQCDAHELAHQWFGDLITAKTVNIIGYKRFAIYCFIS
jgi:aminopeptidase N